MPAVHRPVPRRSTARPPGTPQTVLQEHFRNIQFPQKVFVHNFIVLNLNLNVIFLKNLRKSLELAGGNLAYFPHGTMK